MPNRPDEQYINRLLVTGPKGEPVIQVSLREDIAKFNKTLAPENGFETLNITLDWLGIPMDKMPAPTAYAYRWRKIDFAFGRVPHFMIGDARAEIVIVDGSTAQIVIISTTTEDVDRDTRIQNAHLDFTIRMHQRETCEGVLPELWGLRPLSENTEAMMIPPSTVPKIS